MIWILWILLGIFGLVAGLVAVGGIVFGVEHVQQNRRIAKASSPDQLTTRKLLAVAEKEWKQEYEAAVDEVTECAGCRVERDRRQSEAMARLMSDRYYSGWGYHGEMERIRGLDWVPTSECPRHQHTVAEWW